MGGSVVSAEGGVHGFPVVLTSFIGRDAVMGEVAGLLEDCRLVTGPDGLAALSRRERELVALVARGRTDAQIAAELYISVSTVRTHLDRIRDKTGCRRRADLTRLALQAELA